MLEQCLKIGCSLHKAVLSSSMCSCPSHFKLSYQNKGKKSWEIIFKKWLQPIIGYLNRCRLITCQSSNLLTAVLECNSNMWLKNVCYFYPSDTNLRVESPCWSAASSLHVCDRNDCMINKRTKKRGRKGR